MSQSKKHKQKKKTWFNKLRAVILRQPRNRSHLIKMLHQAEDQELLSTEMLGMIERILQVSEMQVREVMVPKAQMVAIPKNITLGEILPIVIESGHSRFPVLDPTHKDVIGILLAKDLLKNAIQEEKTFDIKQIIRPAFFTPQSKRLDILLRDFRINRNHIAIVLDEYGHVAGLITIEDVLEQIVGEIEDEYDIEEEDGHIKKLEENLFIVKASTLISEFNDYFHTRFSDTSFDTIGGIVLQGFGRLPKRGETIKMQQMRFKVLHSDNRRIYLLEVKHLKPKSPSSHM